MFSVRTVLIDRYLECGEKSIIDGLHGSEAGFSLVGGLHLVFVRRVENVH